MSVYQNQVQGAVIGAYNTLVVSNGGWVSLTRLRDHIGSRYPRPDVDAALTALAVDGWILLIGEVNQKTLTPADRDAALYFAGDHKHLYQVLS